MVHSLMNNHKQSLRKLRVSFQKIFERTELGCVCMLLECLTYCVLIFVSNGLKLSYPSLLCNLSRVAHSVRRFGFVVDIETESVSWMLFRLRLLTLNMILPAKCFVEDW